MWPFFDAGYADGGNSDGGGNDSVRGDKLSRSPTPLPTPPPCPRYPAAADQLLIMYEREDTALPVVGWQGCQGCCGLAGEAEGAQPWEGGGSYPQ